MGLDMSYDSFSAEWAVPLVTPRRSDGLTLATKQTELAELKRIGATPVKNSGRGMWKGDGILEPFLVDVKEYEESFSVSRANWAKLSTDSIQNGRRQPLFFLALGDKKKEQQPVRVFVVGERMFMEMLEAWEEKYND